MSRLPVRCLLTASALSLTALAGCQFGQPQPWGSGRVIHVADHGNKSNNDAVMAQAKPMPQGNAEATVPGKQVAVTSAPSAPIAAPPDAPNFTPPALIDTPAAPIVPPPADSAARTTPIVPPAPEGPPLFATPIDQAPAAANESKRETPPRPRPMEFDLPRGKSVQNAPSLKQPKLPSSLKVELQNDQSLLMPLAPPKPTKSAAEQTLDALQLPKKPVLTLKNEPVELPKTDVPAPKTGVPPVPPAALDAGRKSDFGHAADYSWISGEAIKWRQQWKLRFAAVDEVDPYGGSVILAGEHLPTLKDGERYKLSGRLETGNGRASGPVFFIESVQPLGR